MNKELRHVRNKAIAAVVVVGGAAGLVGMHFSRDLGCRLPKVSPEGSLRESLLMDQLESALAHLPSDLTTIQNPESNLGSKPTWLTLNVTEKVI